MVTGLLLAVAVLVFAGLAYETIPVSTTQTITQESTWTLTSYSPYFVAKTSTYTTTSVTALQQVGIAGGDIGCAYGEPGCSYGPYQYYYYTYYTFVSTWQSTYKTTTTSVIPYSQTTSSSMTLSSTSLVPASVALGLTDGTFSTLAIVIIGLLSLLTIWVALKPRLSHRPIQARLSQFVKPTSVCINCGAKLPPASAFCNKCGSAQD